MLQRLRDWRNYVKSGGWSLLALMLSIPYWWLNTTSILDLGIWPIMGALAYLVWRNHQRGKQIRALRDEVMDLTNTIDQIGTMAEETKARLDVIAPVVTTVP